MKNTVTRDFFVPVTTTNSTYSLVTEFPKRWHVEKYFHVNQALSWNRTDTMNFNICYRQMTMALIAQTAIHQLRQRLSDSYCQWDTNHMSQDIFPGLEGDVRVTDDTIIVTYYNALDDLCCHYEGFPDKLTEGNVERTIL